jgi:hypothetical protein
VLRPAARAVLDHLRELGAQLVRKVRVADDDVRLAREQQAVRVDVRRSDGRPAVVDDGDLRVHERPVVFLDLDAGGEELPVQRPRGIMQQRVLDARLQEQRHAHAPRGRGDERAAEADPREEIGAGDHDLLSRPRDRREVRTLDVAPVPQVVADDEPRVLVADRRHPAVVRKQRHVGALELHQLVDRPHPLHRVHDRREQRALDGDRESMRGGFCRACSCRR